jgi:hypothetical protein
VPYEVFEEEGKVGYVKALDLWLDVYSRPRCFKEKCAWYYGREMNKSKIFLLKEEGCENILGAIGSGNREYSGKYGAKLLGFCLDFAIDEKHRVLGPAIQLLKSLIASQEKTTDILFGYPNNRAVGVMCRAGFTVLSDVSRYAFILNTKYYLTKFRFSFLLGPLSSVLNLVVKSYIAIQRSFQCTGYNFSEVSEIDDSFDKLWSDWVDQCELFAAKRDKAYLTWRFLEHPANNFRLFALRRKNDNQLVGYAVIRPNEEGHWVIFDFFALPSKNILDKLLLSLAAKASSENALSLSVEFLGNRSIRENLIKLKFIERPSERRVVIKPQSSEGEGASYYLDADNWYLTSADELG